MTHPDLQPTLIGPRITVRPIAQADWPEMFAAASDPQIWALHPASDRYQEPVFRRFFDGALASGSGFAFVARESGKIIGSSRYHAYKPADSEIGWTFLTRLYWGGSHNREIKRLMLAHAFTFVDTVAFWVGDRNWRSQAAMEKIGGVRRPGPHTRAPDYAPHVVFEIKKRDFAASPFWTDD